MKKILAGITTLAIAAAIAAPATSAHETLVHAYMAKDGSTVVSGFDGGVALGRP